MSFKPIPVERKVKVIYRVVKGEKIQPIAREARVDRTSIYLWKERALSALREALLDIFFGRVMALALEYFQGLNSPFMRFLK